MSVLDYSFPLSAAIKDTHDGYPKKKVLEKGKLSAFRYCPAPSEEKIKALNKLAREYPFCICFKGKDELL